MNGTNNQYCLFFCPFLLYASGETEAMQLKNVPCSPQCYTFTLLHSSYNAQLPLALAILSTGERNPIYIRGNHTL